MGTADQEYIIRNVKCISLCVVTDYVLQFHECPHDGLIPSQQITTPGLARNNEKQAANEANTAAFVKGTSGDNASAIAAYRA